MLRLSLEVQCCNKLTGILLSVSVLSFMLVELSDNAVECKTVKVILLSLSVYSVTLVDHCGNAMATL